MPLRIPVTVTVLRSVVATACCASTEPEANSNKAQPVATGPSLKRDRCEPCFAKRCSGKIFIHYS